MAYNFPVNYYPQTFPQIPQPQIAPPQNPITNNIIWVSGEAGAKSYMVSPNTTVQLWDSEAPVIYLKSADASGMPSIKVLDYTVRNSEQPKPAIVDTPKIDYVTHDELQAMESKISKMIEDIKQEAGA